jgi:hypothetical protein
MYLTHRERVAFEVRTLTMHREAIRVQDDVSNDVPI